MPEIRLSPSGPRIGNVNQGFILRTQEALGRVNADFPIPLEVNAAPVPNLLCILGRPDRARAYRATLYLDVENSTTNVPTTVSLAIQASYDSGSTWSTVGISDHNLGLGLVVSNGGARQIRTDVTWSPGDHAPWNMPDPSPFEIQVRGLIWAADVSTALIRAPVNANMYLSLSEGLPLTP